MQVNSGRSSFPLQGENKFSGMTSHAPLNGKKNDFWDELKQFCPQKAPIFKNRGRSLIERILVEIKFL